MVNFAGVNFNNKDPVYVQIAVYVKRQILIGNVTSGEELPSRRELAALLEINPNTVQKAYKLMEQEGFVATEGNTGSVIYINEQLLHKIEEELTRGMVFDFIQAAKAVNLSFKRIIDLISEGWDDIS